jgi:hypothetical protein
MTKRGRTNAEIRAEYRKVCELMKEGDDDSILYGIHLALAWVLSRHMIAPSTIGERIYAKPCTPSIE